MDIYEYVEKQLSSDCSIRFHIGGSSTGLTITGVGNVIMCEVEEFPSNCGIAVISNIYVEREPKNCTAEELVVLFLDEVCEELKDSGYTLAMMTQTTDSRIDSQLNEDKLRKHGWKLPKALQFKARRTSNHNTVYYKYV